MENIAIVLSGGTGVRFGSDTPKQYEMLLGKEVIHYTINALKASALTNLIVVAARREDVGRLSSTYGVFCTEGGPSRNASLYNAIAYIERNHPRCANVLIAEAARPFLTAGIVDGYYRYLSDFDAVVTAVRINDSLGREDGVVVDRDAYYLIQAPEAFRFELLRGYFSGDSPITATVQQLPANIRVKKFFDFRHNMKITYEYDLLLAAELMKALKRDEYYP
jgi:2-C-methyl-D-erythritol 4-phosphate cytidylyltransferase/2-C-methyl-D-erythritol 2,4-cyclodiphosphate synthase